MEKLSSKANIVGVSPMKRCLRKAEQARTIAEFLAKPEGKEMSAGLEEIAQAVAVAVEDKALTQRIYEKSMEKFDGATNVLWMQLEADSKLKVSGGWNKRINDVLGKSKRNVQNVEAAIKKFEKTAGAPLHLYWMNAEAWDKKTTPLVAFVLFDVNPKTRTSIPAFDSKGNRVELGKDGALAKQRPVIVVNVNERTDVRGKIKDNLILATNQEKSAKFVLHNSQEASTQNDKKGGSEAHSGGFTIRLNTVWFSPAYAWDELPWDGPSEFMCGTFQSMAVADPNFPGGGYLTVGYIGGAYPGNLSTGVTHSRSDVVGSGVIGLTSYGSADPYGYINWIEDDLDPFDDFMSSHPFQVPSSRGSYPFNGGGDATATYTLSRY